MLKFLIPFLILGASLKEEIGSYQEKITTALSDQVRAECHYQLALAYSKDQEIDKAFHHFLSALTFVSPLAPPLMDEEEKRVYREALADYLAGSDPGQCAVRLLEKYENKIEENPEWVSLSFLLSTAYGNLGKYERFFTHFYHGYRYLGDSFLAAKTRGILYLRLAHHGRSVQERQIFQDKAIECLTLALESNPKDPSLYKVLIFLAKDEKKDTLIHHYLKKMCDERAPFARSDICLYVKEAVEQGDTKLGQEIINVAKSYYDFSRAITAAEEYLNQCIRG